MSKKTNTILFMLVGTIVNILLLGLFFVLGFILLSFYLNANPESTIAPLLIGVIFLGSIALSFLAYSKIVKFCVTKFDLESKMEPLFGGKRKPVKKRDEE